jgi:hypothetical protein
MKLECIHGLEPADLLAADFILSVPRGTEGTCFLDALASSIIFCHSGTTSMHSCLKFAHK